MFLCEMCPSLTITFLPRVTYLTLQTYLSFFMKQIIKLMGSFRNRKDARTLGLEIVLIYHYLTLVTFSHVGKESAVDFNF